MIRSYWKFDYKSLDPSHLARPVERPSGIQVHASGLLELILVEWVYFGFFWLVLVAWLMIFHFFEPSAFR